MGSRRILQGNRQTVDERLSFCADTQKADREKSFAYKYDAEKD